MIIMQKMGKTIREFQGKIIRKSTTTQANKCSGGGGQKLDNKFKHILPVILLLLLITIIIGVTYAVYTLTTIGNENSITTGLVSMSYTESTNVIDIKNALPMSDAEGKTQSNYFDFSVTSNLTLGENDLNTPVSYSIELEPLIKAPGYYLSESSPTDEQITQCENILIDNFGYTLERINNFCTGGEDSNGDTLQNLVDAANSSNAGGVIIFLNKLESTGMVEVVREWNVVDNPTEPQTNSCTTWFLNLYGITEDSSNYQDTYSTYESLCSGEEVQGITLQDFVDAGILTSEQLNSLAETGIIEYNNSLNFDAGYNVLRDNQIKIYLEDTTNNKVLINSKLISDLSNYKLYNTSHIHKYNTNSITTNYRIRAWIDYDVDASEWNENNKYEYKFRINVNSNVDYLKSSDLNSAIQDQVQTMNISYEYINDANVTVDGITYNNGDNGVFLYDGTDDNGGNKPIYYYRGNVNNNYVLFANKCWKIVRTTSTGGTKLIYNGLPDNNGTCTVPDDTRSSRASSASSNYAIGYSEFNANYTSPADVGYMYGTRYTYSSKNMSNITDTYKYGNDVTYSNGTYTLTGKTMDSSSWSTDYKTIADGYHYTCLNSSGTCTSVYYITYFGNSYYMYYLTFTGGDTLDSAKTKMFTNTNDSTIKSVIDEWYESDLTDYTNMLENTIFCNDRSFASGTDGGSLSNKNTNSTGYSFFAGYERTYVTYSPSLQCVNINDRFSLKVGSGGTSGYGNNKLTYPVGLLTYDEVVLAGATGNFGSGKASDGSSGNYNYYLYTGDWYWLLSPNDWSVSDANAGNVLVAGGLAAVIVDRAGGVRPSVSLQPGTQIIRGTGISSDPYVITELS